MLERDSKVKKENQNGERVKEKERKKEERMEKSEKGFIRLKCREMET